MLGRLMLLRQAAPRGWLAIGLHSRSGGLRRHGSPESLVAAAWAVRSRRTLVPRMWGLPIGQGSSSPQAAPAQHK
ncbi:unnamed protein product [Urochloa humidicola]